MGAFQKVTIILVHRNVYGGHGAFKLLKPFSGRAELGGAAYDAYFCMTVSYQLHGHLVSADAEVCIGKIPDKSGMINATVYQDSGYFLA